MLQYPAPTDQKKLRCVLGLFQFYKKFIASNSHIVQTLNRLLGKDIDFKWTSVENDAFMELRERLKNAPFKEYPTATGKYTLITDASKATIGYLLNQESEDGVQHLIACRRRSLHPAERNYTITELELLSIIEARKILPQLTWETFYSKIRPCQSSIFKQFKRQQFLNSLKNSGAGRFHRWSLRLQQYS